MPSWRSALSHVVANPERVVYEITTADTGYAFPDPGLFVGVTSVEKQTMYFVNWIKYRDALIYRLAFSLSTSTFSNKFWWPLLNLPSNHNPMAPPKHDISEKKSRSQQQHDVVYTLLESCFNVRSLHSPPFSGWTPLGLRQTRPIQNANFLALELLEFSGDFPVIFRCRSADW